MGESSVSRVPGCGASSADPAHGSDKTDDVPSTPKGSMKVDPAATPLSNKSESAVEAVSPGGSTVFSTVANGMRRRPYAYSMRQVLGPANEIPGGVEVQILHTVLASHDEHL